MKNILFITAVLFTAACSDKPEALSSPLLERASQLASVKAGSDLSPYYTSDTIAEAERISKTNSGTDVLTGLDRKLFITGSSYAVVSEQKNGERALCRIRITAHPSPNMRGLEVSIPLSFEKSAWKIDRADELRRIR